MKSANAGIALSLVLSIAGACTAGGPPDEEVDTRSSAVQKNPNIKLYRKVASDSGLDEFHLTATGKPIRLLGVFLPADNIPGFALNGTVTSYVETFFDRYTGAMPNLPGTTNPVLSYNISTYAYEGQVTPYGGPGESNGRDLQAVQDVARLIRWSGFNTVRYGVSLQAFFPDLQAKLPTPNWCNYQDPQIKSYVTSHMTSEIAEIEKPGLYVIIDLHGQVGNVASQSNATQYGCWQHVLDTFWQTVAQTFVSDPYIAAYELYNERKQACNDAASCQPTRTFYETLAGDVRAHDGATPLIVGDSNAGWQSGTSPGPALETWGVGGNLLTSGMVLSRHTATDLSGSYTLPEYGINYCGPGTIENSGLDGYDALALDAKRALWIGEVEAAEGDDPAPPSECTPFTVNTFAAQALAGLAQDPRNASAALFTMNDLVAPTWVYLNEVQQHPFNSRRTASGATVAITYPSGSTYNTWPPDH